MFSQYNIFLHFHTIFLQTKEITGELNRDVPGGPGTHVGRPPRPDAVVEPVLALAACRMTRTSQDVNGKIFLQTWGETGRGGASDRALCAGGGGADRRSDVSEVALNDAKTVRRYNFV